MARLFMQAYSLFQPCQTDAQISFLQNCLMNTAVIRAGICFSGPAGMQADPYDLPKTICQNGRKAI